MNRPARVLYVDDSRLDRELVRDALSHSTPAYELIDVSNQADFETQLRLGQFDLILSDFNIAGFEGTQVIDAAQAAHPNVPVVIVTGTGSEEIAVEAMKRGAADYVLKTPNHIQRLPLTLSAVLDRARLRVERTKLERRLQQAQRLESLGILAGGVAHDFNNLLTGVLGHLGLLRRDCAGNARAIERIGKVETITEQAAGLCRQLLAFSGKGRLALEPVDLNDIVRTTVPLVEHCRPPGVDVDLRLGEGLPRVSADATQLRQVVMNLIINAFEAMSGRSGRVRVVTTERPAGDAEWSGPCPPVGPPELPMVALEVRDEGPGMSAETAARVFDPFFSTKFAGRGLGLAAVLGIVRGHHGCVAVTSSPGQGSCFATLFPRAGATSPHNAAVASPNNGTSHTALVIDDEDVVCQVVSDILRGAGLSAECVNDGPSGLNRLAANPHGFCCVLLDLTMPDMTGDEVARVIAAEYEHVPVVVMSGYSDSAEAIPGAIDFLAKPFTPESLLSAVRRVIGHG